MLLILKLQQIESYFFYSLPLFWLWVNYSLVPAGWQGDIEISRLELGCY